MDIKGDKAKQPAGCKDGSTDCPNLKNIYEGYDGERWQCEVCGESFYLDYDEMR